MKVESSGSNLRSKQRSWSDAHHQTMKTIIIAIPSMMMMMMTMITITVILGSDNDDNEDTVLCQARGVFHLHDYDGILREARETKVTSSHVIQ